MEAYALEWLNLLLRWTHLIVGIAWIGASFYFVWLDLNLNRPPRDPENDRIDGDLWAVHGGGFYHAQKYRVAPATLPEPLHWFKWEAYTTWLTGFALLTVLYYANAEQYLIDPSIRALTAPMAVGISLVLLVAGWLVYDLLCRRIADNRVLAGVALVLLTGLAYGLSFVFSGRGMFMQLGAMLGTIMAANVLMIIIPGQRELVAAKERGEEPDPAPGLAGKQRSVHNNYITLPVLFVMISNHYPMTYGHAQNWLIFIAFTLIGALIRHYFNLKNQGRHVPAIPVAAAICVAVLAVAIAPRPRAADGAPAVSLASAHAVISNRCVACHAQEPVHPTAPVAPKGVMLDTPERLEQWADSVYQQTVISRAMPLGNLTGITDDERDLIRRWYEGRDGNSS